MQHISCHCWDSSAQNSWGSGQPSRFNSARCVRDGDLFVRGTVGAHVTAAAVVSWFW